MTCIHEISLNTIDGQPLDLAQFAGRALLVVNVASKCGLTPQYTGLQALYDRYRDRGLSVLAIPCNQFAGQEPGTPEEIASFCSTTYHVTFPLAQKTDVNGRRRHPLYGELSQAPDADGRRGDVEWNFEKFLVSGAGEVVARFRPRTDPQAPEVLEAIERALPSALEGVWTATSAGELRPGDRIRLGEDDEMTVSRIIPNFFEHDGLCCLNEDTDERWLARTMPGDQEVEVLR